MILIGLRLVLENDAVKWKDLVEIIRDMDFYAP